MRRTMLFVAATALALVLAAGVALAQPFGDQGPGVTRFCQTNCVGTTYPDTLIGSNAPNTIHGLGATNRPPLATTSQATAATTPSTAKPVVTG